MARNTSFNGKVILKARVGVGSKGVTHYRVSRNGFNVGSGATGKSSKEKGRFIASVTPAVSMRHFPLKGSFKNRTAAKAAIQKFFRNS